MIIKMSPGEKGVIVERSGKLGKARCGMLPFYHETVGEESIYLILSSSVDRNIDPNSSTFERGLSRARSVGLAVSRRFTVRSRKQSHRLPRITARLNVLIVSIRRNLIYELRVLLINIRLISPILHHVQIVRSE